MAFFYVGWSGTESTGYLVLLYQPRMMYNWQGKPNYSQKTCPSAALSTTNPI
jgi:hypothetical protein